MRKKGQVNAFPRVRYYGRKELKNKELDKILLDRIKDNDPSFEVYTSSFDVLGSKVLMFDNSYEYALYVKKNKNQTLENVDIINNDIIHEFVLRICAIKAKSSVV